MLFWEKAIVPKMGLMNLSGIQIQSELTFPFEMKQIFVFISRIMTIDTNCSKFFASVRNFNGLEIMVDRAHEVKDRAVDGQIFLGSGHCDVQQILFVLLRLDPI